MAMIEVALFTSFGSTPCIQKVRDVLDAYDFPQNRIELAKYIKENAIEIDRNDVYGFMAEHKDFIGYLDDLRYPDKRGYYMDIGKMGLAAISIRTVDTSRPWLVSEYDGAEGIEYLDYKIINKEYNYGKKIG
jgi:hypothetical protein